MVEKPIRINELREPVVELAKTERGDRTGPNPGFKCSLTRVAVPLPSAKSTN